MILIDTSMWVDHLCKGNSQVENLLLDAEVACHPFIIGELACGNLKNRSEILTLLQALPMTPSIDLDEYLFFIEQNRLHGIGIGFVDIHLLASSKLANSPLWTAGKKLKAAAGNLGLSFKP
jgi:predicted nucleic acid-binding protein